MDESTIKEQMESIGNIQTFMIHLYRSETAREAALRGRLDVTIGGAVVVTSTLVPLAFSSPDVSHVVLLANGLLLLIFLLVEARRFQMHEMILKRVRSIERDYIAPLINQIALEPRAIQYRPHVHLSLVDNLLHYEAPISRFEAAVSRLRSVYIYLFGIIYVVWLQKILRDLTGQPPLDHINRQAEIGSIPGNAVFFVVTALMLAALILVLFARWADHHSNSL
jgi:uncharacterized membrane protein